MSQKKNSIGAKSMVLFAFLFVGETALYADFNKQNGVITDSTTKLEWQDDYLENEYGKIRTNWKSAIDYCEALSLDGGGWRLPNIRELASLVDDSKYAPAINSIFELPSTFTRSYWSSTTMLSGNGTAFFIEFNYGNISYKGDKNGNAYVRCVRAGE